MNSLREQQYQAMEGVELLPAIGGAEELRYYGDIAAHYLAATLEGYPTALGEHHAQQSPRFSARYGYDPRAMRTDFGHAVDGVFHGPHVRRIYQGFGAVLLKSDSQLDYDPWAIQAMGFSLDTHDYL